jgi:hypothetical protein
MGGTSAGKKAEIIPNTSFLINLKSPNARYPFTAFSGITENSI